MGGLMAQILPHDSFIPTRKTRKFELVGKDHDIVTIRVLGGERPMTEGNISLASFDLKHSPATAEGRPQIEISVAVDADGSVEVSALDVRSGRSNSTMITSAFARLTEEEIEKRLMTAAVHTDADYELLARAAATVEESGEKMGQSELIHIPEDRSSLGNRNILDEHPWELGTWLSSMISRANKAGRGSLNWHGDRDSRQAAEHDDEL